MDTKICGDGGRVWGVFPFTGGWGGPATVVKVTFDSVRRLQFGTPWVLATRGKRFSRG